MTMITPTKNVSFGEAVEALKKGERVCREGWNGKGMWLYLINGCPVNGHLNASHPDTVVEGIPKNLAGQMLPHIVMKTAGDSKLWGTGYADYVPWLASQTDILSEDWIILY